MNSTFTQLVMKYHDVLTKAETVINEDIRQSYYNEAKKLQDLIKKCLANAAKNGTLSQ